MLSYKLGLEDMNWHELIKLYEKVGMLRHLIENKEFDKIQTAFEKSYKVVTAWDEKELVGSCRMLSDGICYGVVFDVAVLPDYKKKNVAEGLLTLLLKGEESMPIHLTSAFGNEDLYAKLGFKNHKSAYAKYPYKTKTVSE